MSLMVIRKLISSCLPPIFLRKRIAKGTIFSLFAAMVLQVSGLLVSVFSARILGISGFGEFNLFRSTILMFVVIAGSGFGVVATKYISQYQEINPDIAGEKIGFLLRCTYLAGIFATILCFILAFPIASIAINSPQLTEMVRIGCILLLLYSISGVQIGVLCGFESFNKILKLNCWEALLNLFFIPTGAHLFGLKGAVGGTVIAAIAVFPLKNMAMIRECRCRNIKITYKKNNKNSSELFLTLLPSMLLGFAFCPFEWISKLLLARQQDGLFQLGIFAAANSFATLVSYIPGQLLSTAQPLYGNLLGKCEVASFKQLARFNLLLSGVSAIFIAISICLLSEKLMGIYGYTFRGGTNALWVISFANVFFALVTPYYKAMISFNEIWMQAFFTLLLGLSLVLSTYYFAHIGALGLAYSYLIAWVTMFFLESLWIWNNIWNSYGRDINIS